jgi:hypothetical protein
MKIPILVGAYSGISLDADAQDCVNFRFEKDPKGRSALVGMPGLLRRAVVPSLPATYRDDWIRLQGFGHPYEAPDGATFEMTSELGLTQTGDAVATGRLTGLSADPEHPDYYGNFVLGIYTVKGYRSYHCLGRWVVDSAAAGGTWTFILPVTLSVESHGVKVLLLERKTDEILYVIAGHGSGYKTISAAPAVTDLLQVATPGRAMVFYRDGTELDLAEITRVGYDGETVSLHGYDADELSNPPTHLRIRAIAGLAYFPQSFYRSYDAPRPGEPVTTILPEHEYQVLGVDFRIAYDGQEYGSGETFVGTRAATGYTVVAGAGTVTDRTLWRRWQVEGYQTRVQDQARAVLAACAYGDATVADRLCAQLLRCRLTDSMLPGLEAYHYLFAARYRTLQYSWADDAWAPAQELSVQLTVRTGAVAWAVLALLFYRETFPDGESFAAAGTAVTQALDTLADAWLVSPEHPQGWLVRAGTGRWEFRDPALPFVHALCPSVWLEDNLLLWWALHEAEVQGLVSASPTLAALERTYGKWADEMQSVLLEDSTEGGAWLPVQQRPLHGKLALPLLSAEVSTRTLRVARDWTTLLDIGRTFPVREHAVAGQNQTYTITAAALDDTQTDSGELIAGRTYRVVGRIRYDGLDYGGSVSRPALLVAGSTTTYTTLEPATVTPWETVVTVAEAPVSDEGGGYAFIDDHTPSLEVAILYLLFCQRAGRRTRRDLLKTQIERFWIDQDRDYPEVGGYRPYLAQVPEDHLEAFDLWNGPGLLPWSRSYPLAAASVDYERSFLAMLGWAGIGAYSPWQRIWDALAPGYERVPRGYPHTSTEMTEPAVKGAEIAFLEPIDPYALEGYASLSATALGVLAQKPSGFWGSDSTVLEVPGRSVECDIRGLAVLQNRLYAVCGNIVVSWDADLEDLQLVSTSRLFRDTGPVFLADNGYQLLITEGDPVGYLYDQPSATWHRLGEDQGFLGGGSVAVLDGIFLSATPDSDQIVYSSPYAAPNHTDYGAEGVRGGLEWDAGSYFSAVERPGRIVRLVADSGRLLVLKEHSAELFYNSGFGDGPFTKLSGGDLSVGCAAAHSAVSLDSTIYWLADDYTVRRLANGAQVVSLPSLTQRVQGYSDITSAHGLGYRDQGHAFFQLTFPGGEDTWVFDVGMQEWTRRQSYRTGIDLTGRHRAVSYVRFREQHLLGDFEHPFIYSLEPETYTDDGHRILRWVRGPLIHDEDDRRRYDIRRLELEFEGGVGLVAGQGSDPQVMLKWSRDKGHTWSNELWRSVGRMGHYSHRAAWNRLGSTRDLNLHIQVSDPVKWVLLGAVINPEDA